MVTYSIGEFDKIFKRISGRVDASIVFNSFLDYCIQKIIGYKDIKLDYNFSDGELQEFNNLYDYWLKLTEQEMNKDDAFDFFGIYYEEYILASDKASNKGQFFSPQSVCDLLAYISPLNKNVVYDPACGSGRMALSYWKVNKNINCILEDLDEMACKMAVLNLYAHNINGTVQWLDSLTRTHYLTWQIKNKKILLTDYQDLHYGDYDLVLANPPYGIKWQQDKSLLEDERFKEYGKLAPKSKADFAFIQHSLHYLKEDGFASILMPHGVLFRGASEGHIRKYLIDNNLLDSIIGLPSNLFEGTGIPTVLLLFKKNRKNRDIFFIDAKDEFIKERKINKLTPDNIDKIINVYLERENTHKFSFKASLEFIQENDYNCNIPRYVDTFEEEPEVDLKILVDAMEENIDEQIEVNKQLKGYFEELTLPSPWDSEALRLEDSKSLVLAAKKMVQSTLDQYMEDYTI